MAEYDGFLPGGRLLARLADWVRLYVGYELAWDVRLVLKHDAVPLLRLGRGARLGWTTWLGVRKRGSDADDLCLDVEAFTAGRS